MTQTGCLRNGGLDKAQGLDGDGILGSCCGDSIISIGDQWLSSPPGVGGGKEVIYATAPETL
jgi:hypothetical protein